MTAGLWRLKSRSGSEWGTQGPRWEQSNQFRTSRKGLQRRDHLGRVGETSLLMEFVEGVGLDQLIEERGSLPVTEACEVVRQAAVGLQNCGPSRACVRGHWPMLQELRAAVPGSAEPGASAWAFSFWNTVEYVGAPNGGCPASRWYSVQPRL
jgi:hypothetical protein